MWQIDNQTPYAAQRAGIRDREGREAWQVVVKATYHFDPAGKIRIAEEQPPVNLACRYRDSENDSSLLYESDFVLEKQQSDILLNATAWAPPGKAVTRLKAGFTVGGLAKSIQVTGHRYWRKKAAALSASEPEPFRQMPLIWENAYGGEDGVNGTTGFPIAYEPNPVGKGFHTRRGHANGQPLPNIEYANRPLITCLDQIPPAGFGPVASHWLPRSRHGGTYDEAWQRTRAPLLPEDLSPRYYQCAPEDQQYPGLLQGGEPVRLINLTPEGEVNFILPGLAFRFTTKFDGLPGKHQEARITGLIIEPDESRFSLVFQSDLPCQGDEDELLTTIIEEMEAT